MEQNQNPKTPTHFAVPVELVQSIANYLAKHPYAEVSKIISQLEKCQLINLQDNE